MTALDVSNDSNDDLLLFKSDMLSFSLLKVDLAKLRRAACLMRVDWCILIYIYNYWNAIPMCSCSCVHVCATTCLIFIHQIWQAGIVFKNAFDMIIQHDKFIFAFNFLLIPTYICNADHLYFTYHVVSLSRDSGNIVLSTCARLRTCDPGGVRFNMLRPTPLDTLARPADLGSRLVMA